MTAILAPCAAFGQAAKYGVDLDKPSCEGVPSPDFGVGKKDTKPRKWLALEAKLKLNPSDKEGKEVCHSMKVRWHLLVRLPNAPKARLFSKEIEHINVPLDRDVHCSVYLSPASLERIAPGLKENDDPTKLAQHWGCEVEINGVVVGRASAGELEFKKEEAWWNLKSDRIESSEIVRLLDKSMTPFSSLWWDRYAEIAPSNQPSPSAKP